VTAYGLAMTEKGSGYHQNDLGITKVCFLTLVAYISNAGKCRVLQGNARQCRVMQGNAG